MAGLIISIDSSAIHIVAVHDHIFAQAKEIYENSEFSSDSNDDGYWKIINLINEDQNPDNIIEYHILRNYSLKDIKLPEHQGILTLPLL